MRYMYAFSIREKKSQRIEDAPIYMYDRQDEFITGGGGCAHAARDEESELARLDASGWMRLDFFEVGREGRRMAFPWGVKRNGGKDRQEGFPCKSTSMLNFILCVAFSSLAYYTMHCIRYFHCCCSIGCHTCYCTFSCLILT